jgi:hypothetical protein
MDLLLGVSHAEVSEPESRFEMRAYLALRGTWIELKWQNNRIGCESCFETRGTEMTTSHWCLSTVTLLLWRRNGGSWTMHLFCLPAVCETHVGWNHFHPGNIQTVDRNELSDRGLFTLKKSTDEIKIIKWTQALRNTMRSIQHRKHFLQCFQNRDNCGCCVMYYCPFPTKDNNATFILFANTPHLISSSINTMVVVKCWKVRMNPVNVKVKLPLCLVD